MRNSNKRVAWPLWLIGCTLLGGWLNTAPIMAENVIFRLKNGMEVRGRYNRLRSIGKDALSPTGSAGNVDAALVYFVDNGLRRTFFSTYQKQGPPQLDPERFESIKLKQPVSANGMRLGILGAIKQTTRFNELGHRTCTLMSVKGEVAVVQGIAEITPLWTRLEGLKTDPAFVWDMRVATSSIPRDDLSKVLRKHLGNDDPNKRLSIVRLYLQSERYGDAEEELKETIRDFPELADLKRQLTELQQLKAKQYFQEIQLLSSSGQHRRAVQFLKGFPTDNVADETLIQVNELENDYQAAWKKSRRAIELISKNLGLLPEGNSRQRIVAFQEELERDVSFDTIDRLADFLNLADDEGVAEDQRETGEQKLALAISGWLLGSGASENNLSVALSLFDVRRLVIAYLRTGPGEDVERTHILDELTSCEGSDPQRLVKMLAALKPPIETPELEERMRRAKEAPADAKETAPKQPELTSAGMFEIKIPGLPGEDFTYLIQLPMEYDPYRRYPAVVTLHGQNTNPSLQVDWWAGRYDPKTQRRFGQATRHGYIVIAPAWTEAGQKRYGYSTREHAAVLFSLRDACQRFSVDTDRVFLSGHSVGGDAAWDIGLSHPDLWAGVIPIVAVSNYSEPNSPGYVKQYWRNASYVPLYFVGGSLDRRKPSASSVVLDRYLKTSGFDVMVTEYLGRGHEHFSDDIHRIFQWMNLHRRAPDIRKFEVKSMRTSDYFFWWIELSDLPSELMVDPVEWEMGKKARPTSIVSEIRGNNIVILKTAAAQATFWFGPGMLNLDRPLRLEINTASQKKLTLKPDVKTLLEDARTRGDRQHPFWIKLPVATGRPVR